MTNLPVSTIICSVYFHQITCCHCNVDNWVHDNSRDYNVEKITCWNCNKDSLTQGTEEFICSMDEMCHQEVGYKTLRDAILFWPGPESLGEPDNRRK